MRHHRRRSIPSLAVLVGLIAATFLVASPKVPADAVVPGDNGLIAFQSDRDGEWEIYVAEADGSGQTPLTDNSVSDTVPAWSPDGTKIAFTSNRDGNNEIYVMNADGSGQTRLTNNGASDSTPTWSPDGTQIAFVSQRDGYWQVYAMNSDGSNETNVSSSLVADLHPSWSPDGTKIAFARDSGGHGDVYVMGADGSDQIRLTFDTAQDMLPAWSPDGGTIAFANNSYGGGAAHFDVYLMTPAGAPLGNLTSTYDATETRPAWSPDGGSIAYAGSATATGPFDIWVMGADGTNRTKIVDSPGSDYWPDWQAAGSTGSGSITIVQDAQPDKARDFAYSVSGTGVSPFTLDDDTDPTLLSSITFSGLEAGTYKFTQAAVAAWKLTGIDCDGGWANLTKRRATIDLGPGQDVTCTFYDGWLRPDALVATASTGPFSGEDLYSSTVVVGQTRVADIARGATRTFFVQVGNDGGVPDMQRLTGISSGSPGYTVKYKRGSVNITEAVVAGTYLTEALAPGASIVVKVKITATTAAAAGSVRNADVTVRSTSDGTQRDVVRARVHRV